MSGAAAHLPYPAAIDSYQHGGFRFAGMSHRGSLLCLPDGIWPCAAATAAEICEATLAPVLAAARRIDLFIVGGGRAPWIVPATLRDLMRASGLAVETMPTAAAISTYNILLGEGRRVAALLVAVA
ncbi:MAG: Mth938-like domain-containing protein [Proteobacteria bacterium]|nr:Mth938-like domain-containing protein [Pseudomonadota bacterium]